MQSLIALSYQKIICTILLLVLTAAGDTGRFKSLLKSIIIRWTSAYWDVRCCEVEQLTECSSAYSNADWCNGVLFLLQAEMSVAFPHSRNEGVNLLVE
jgi:hypothetical protein